MFDHSIAQHKHGRDGTRRLSGLQSQWSATTSVIKEVFAVDSHLQLHVTLTGLLQLQKAKSLCEIPYVNACLTAYSDADLGVGGVYAAVLDVEHEQADDQDEDQQRNNNCQCNGRRSAASVRRES